MTPVEKKDWKHLRMEYQRSHNGRDLRLQSGAGRDCDLPSGLRCPCCNAPVDYIYRINGSKDNAFVRPAGRCFLLDQTL